MLVCIIEVALLHADLYLHAHLSKQLHHAMLLLMKHCENSPETSWQHAYVAAVF